MSLRRPAKEQPKEFIFTQDSLVAAREIVSNYPKGKQQSAVMALFILHKNKMVIGYH